MLPCVQYKGLIRRWREKSDPAALFFPTPTEIARFSMLCVAITMYNICITKAGSPFQTYHNNITKNTMAMSKEHLKGGAIIWCPDRRISSSRQKAHHNFKNKGWPRKWREKYRIRPHSSLSWAWNRLSFMLCITITMYNRHITTIDNPPYLCYNDIIRKRLPSTKGWI